MDYNSKEDFNKEVNRLIERKEGFYNELLQVLHELGEYAGSDYVKNDSLDKHIALVAYETLEWICYTNSYTKEKRTSLHVSLIASDRIFTLYRCLEDNNMEKYSKLKKLIEKASFLVHSYRLQ